MALTHNKTVYSLGKKSVDIIEFGKGLYNKMSVILMPARVGSDDGPKGDASDLLKLTMFEGIAALAAVYKQFEFDPRKRLILAGHTDPGGDNVVHFDLAAGRAEAVYCLLTGKKDRWAKLASEKHIIQDYKWIMTYFNFARADFTCDPGKIDNNWNDNTLKATRGFFKSAKKHFKLAIADDLADKVKDDANKKWPEVIWKAVFDLYIEEICAILKIKLPALKKIRTKNLTFAMKKNEFLGCGSSFPLKDPAASKYREDKYRRVEALFFYWDDVPARKKGTPRFVCLPPGKDLHPAGKCPIFYDGHFRANYINPLDDLSMVAYHMKFDFFNPIILKKKKPQITQVPEGLTITAYHYTGTGAGKRKEEIKSITKYHKGIYTVKVLDDDARKDIYFEFKSVVTLVPKLMRKWVYTKNQSTKPKLVSKNDDDIKKLAVPEKFAERLCYYDLPHEWCSENYWVRYKDGTAWKSGRFQDVLKKKMKLKPYGKKKAKVNNPLIFSLDDIVLVDATGKQDIKDKDQNDVTKALSDKSRLTMFHVVDRKLVLYKPRKDSTDSLPAATSASFSQVGFKVESPGPKYRNLITDVPPGLRGIMFANNFYGVFDKRAGQVAGTFEPDKMHVKGCRAARLKDLDSHCTVVEKYTNAAPHMRYFCKGVGNYELHYIHLGCQYKGPGGLKARSFMIIHWHGRFKGVTDATKPHPIQAVDVERYEKLGLKNSKNRWDSKDYSFEPKKLDAAKKGKVQIKPFYYFEAKRADRGGKHKCTVSITNDPSDGSMGVSTSKMFYKDFQIRNYLNLNPHAYADYDGRSYKVLVVSHELGHAIGLDDDYAYHSGEHKTTDDARFGQYYLGMPYHHDTGSMMSSNRAPRSRQLWHFLNRLNDAADDNNELQQLLNGTEYKLVNRFSKGGKRRNLGYHLAKTPNDYRDIYKPFKDKRGQNAGTGKVDLFLYKLGEDEMAWSIKINNANTAFAFDGLMVVFIKVLFRFRDYHDTSHPDPAHHKWYRWSQPTAPDKDTWMEGVKGEIKKLNNRFYLENNGTKKDFRRNYLFFFPICHDYDYIKSEHGNADATATGNKAHYIIEVTYDKTNKVPARTAPKSKLKVGNLASKKWIARYIIGKDPGGTTAPNSANITAADFRYVRDWIRSAAALNDASFNIKGA